MMINKAYLFIRFLLVYLCCIKTHAQIFSAEENHALSLSGYVKSYGQFDEQGQQQVLMPMRFMANYQTLHQGITANYQLHYGLTPQLSSNNFAGALFHTEDFRLTDPSPILTEQGKRARVLHNLDRLNVQFQFNQAELTLGRQVLSFGLARFINPTDIFKPYGLLALDQEYRVGIDALSYRQYLADFSVLNAGWVSMEGGNGLFVKAKHTLGRVDMELVALDLPNANLLGFSLQTSLQNNSLWFESASMLAKDNTFTDYNRTSLGMDMSFFTDSLLSFELHYNQAGQTQKTNYLQVVNSLAYQNYGVSLLGQHYVLAAFSYTVNPLWNVGISAYGNLDDQSTFLNLVASTSWNDDVYSDFSLDYGMGTEGVNGIDTSEFSNALRRITISLAYYF